MSNVIYGKGNAGGRESGYEDSIWGCGYGSGYGYIWIEGIMWGDGKCQY